MWTSRAIPLEMYQGTTNKELLWEGGEGGQKVRLPGKFCKYVRAQHSRALIDLNSIQGKSILSCFLVV